MLSMVRALPSSLPPLTSSVQNHEEVEEQDSRKERRQNQPKSEPKP